MNNKLICVALSFLFVTACSQTNTNHLEKLTIKNTPSAISIIGDFADGIKYADAEGSHTIIISVLNNGKISEKGWLSEIYASKYTLKNGTFLKDWEISDQSKDIFTETKYLQNSLKLIDVDSDGVLESRFLYQLTHSGDPFTVKYLFHYKNIEYMIYGEVPIGFDESTDCETIFSVSFKKLSEKCASYTKNDWNNTMKETFYCFIVGK